MLRITVTDNPETVRFILEGSLAGAWVAELDRTWRAFIPALESKRLSMDLRAVSFIDGAGRQLLADIHKRTKAEFQTTSLFIDYLVQEAKATR